MEAGVQLMDTSNNPQANYPYREIIGSLMYVVTTTQLDITFVTSTLTQFAQKPAWVHWEAAK